MVIEVSVYELDAPVAVTVCYSVAVVVPDSRNRES